MDALWPRSLGLKQKWGADAKKKIRNTVFGIKLVMKAVLIKSS